MFCDEIIREVYVCLPDDDRNKDSFLDCYHDLAYHVTKGYAYVLKTENYFIRLDYDGVKIVSVDESVVLPGEYMEASVRVDEYDDIPRVDFENTLFVGERLVEVKEKDNHYLAIFDDFTLKIIPYENGDDIVGLHNKNPWSYNHVYGVERLLTRKCDCGGTGEVFLDFVADYVVSCNACKKSTWAGMNAIDAIDDWNKGETPCDLSNIEIE